MNIQNQDIPFAGTEEMVSRRLQARQSDPKLIQADERLILCSKHLQISVNVLKKRERQTTALP